MAHGSSTAQAASQCKKNMEVLMSYQGNTKETYLMYFRNGEIAAVGSGAGSVSFDSRSEEEQMGKRSVHDTSTTITTATDSGEQSDGTSTSQSNNHTGEPMRKRQASESSGDDDEEEQQNISLSNNKEQQQKQQPLPDPNVKISPDEYLLQLVKAMYGVSMEVKPALSLQSFFAEVSEAQMAAYNTEVVCAARNNNLDELKRLQQEGGQAMNCFNRFGESLLNLACRRGFESIVEYLLEQPEISLRICDDGGRTPLHDACWHPSPQLTICKWIIERDPSLFLISDKRGFTAFQYARPQHWDVWRKFLFDNRDSLQALKSPDILERLAKTV